MRLSLGTRLVLAMAAIAALADTIAVAMLVSLHTTTTRMGSIVEDSLPSLKAAEEVEIALSDQKGVVTSYILSEGDQSWLEQLQGAKAAFGHWLSRARASAHDFQEKEILGRLQKSYAEYAAKRDKAVLQANEGRHEAAVATVRNEVWPAFREAYRQCEELIDKIDGNIESATEHARHSSVMAAWFVSLGSVTIAGLAVALVWLLVQRVFVPLRRLANDAQAHEGYSPDEAAELADDEVRSVGRHFRTIMANAAETRSALEESRNRMWNAEKLAAVGKLTASVAHEMRNPLSSMKMWLYSIRKAGGADPALEHKYQILGEEINRLEGIVRNVLEFSRPPSTKIGSHDIVQILGKTLEIVHPWLETKNIRVVQDYAAGLPRVMADAEQLRQVFVNLLDNAAEAMAEGGEISISCRAEDDAVGTGSVVTRVTDTGSGIPDEIRSRLFEPFFTTKEQGTGLGLCIAANILAAQGGQLVLESSTAGGSTFAVRLPRALEKGDEPDSHR